MRHVRVEKRRKDYIVLPMDMPNKAGRTAGKNSQLTAYGGSPVAPFLGAVMEGADSQDAGKQCRPWNRIYHCFNP
jgi:hypothetical protein